MDKLWTGSVDAHVHAYDIGDADFFEAYRRKQGLSYINVVSVSCKKPREYAQNALALNMKRSSPYVYAHASLVYDELPVRASAENARDFVRQAQYYRAAGFDGIKILETKPTSFKKTRLSLSDITYEPFFDELEKQGTHIVWHACDPDTFWDADRAPAFAREEGWFYGDGTFETFESLFNQVLQVLERHPKLNATMAHFFFLSEHIPTAAALLDKYPRLCLDITPGRCMYENFTRDYERAREFFNKYYDRIHFGTDMTCTEFQGDQDALVGAVRRFLSTEDKFSYWEFDIRGIGLPSEKVRAIAGDNFRRDVGDRPREVNEEILNQITESARCSQYGES